MGGEQGREGMPYRSTAPRSNPAHLWVRASDTSGQGAKDMGALSGTPTAGSMGATLSPPIPKRPIRAGFSSVPESYRWLSCPCQAKTLPECSAHTCTGISLTPVLGHQ